MLKEQIPMKLTGDDRRTIRGKLLSILITHCKGRVNAFTGKQLAYQLDQHDDRKIRLVIRELITEGHPIASSVSPPAGYYIVLERKEAEGYINVLKARINEDQNRLRDFQIAVRKAGIEEIKYTRTTKEDN